MSLLPPPLAWPDKHELETLKNLFPIEGLIDISLQPAQTQWVRDRLSPPQLLAITALATSAPSEPMPPAERWLTGVTGAQSEEATFYHANVPLASGLVPPDNFQHIWGNIETLSTEIRKISTLDEVCEPNHQQEFFANWLRIDYLSPLETLKGARNTLKNIDVLIVTFETKLDENAQRSVSQETEEILNDYINLYTIPHRNPQLLTKVYVKNWKKIGSDSLAAEREKHGALLEQQAARLSSADQSIKELQALLLASRQSNDDLMEKLSLLEREKSDCSNELSETRKKLANSELVSRTVMDIAEQISKQREEAIELVAPLHSSLRSLGDRLEKLQGDCNLKAKTNNNRINIIESEFELLKHEQSLPELRKKTLEKLITPNKKHKEEYSRLLWSSKSQLGQDIWVLHHLDYKKKGFFVEFGASNGVTLSNTYLLEKEYGWKGILCEPNPSLYQQLEQNRDCICTRDCIAGIAGEKISFILAEEYGVISNYKDLDQHSQIRESYAALTPSIELTTTTLNKVLEENNAPSHIDYISIDTEGNELEILEAFDFERWNVHTFSVEHNYVTEKRTKVQELMKNAGYSVYEAEWDDWFLKNQD